MLFGQDFEEITVLFNAHHDNFWFAFLGEHVGFTLFRHLFNEASEVCPGREGVDQFGWS